MSFPPSSPVSHIDTPGDIPTYIASVRAPDTEKGQQERIFSPYPTYTHLPPAYEDPIVDVQGRRVSRRRRCLRIVLHAVLLTSVAIFFFPGIVHKFVRAWRGIQMDGSYGTYEGVDNCVRFADWSSLQAGEYFSPLSENSAPYPYAAKANLDLPVSSDLLYFLSHGALSSGVVQLAADGDSDSDVATVSVQLLYHHPEFLEDAHVCLLQREEGKNGVGIFTPDYHHRHPHHRPSHRPFFSMKISLPAPAGRELLKIKGLETNMPMFVHLFEELESLVDFKTLKLRASNTAIVVKSVYAEAADVETSNGPIYGNYTTSNYLSLRSSNGPITTNVTLVNAAADHPTEVEMRTSNAHLTSNLTLISTADHHVGGNFKVKTRTSNSPMDVTFVEAPVDSVLQFEGHTSNSPARATLHTTFEGDFFLRTSSWFPVNLDHNDAVADPAGKGRKREFNVKRVNRGTSEGTVRWVPGDDRELGSAVLTTSNSPIALKL